jgi:hypothetical protein
MPVLLHCKMCGRSEEVPSNRKRCRNCGCKLPSQLTFTPIKATASRGPKPAKPA